MPSVKNNVKDNKAEVEEVVKSDSGFTAPTTDSKDDKIKELENKIEQLMAAMNFSIRTDNVKNDESVSITSLYNGILNLSNGRTTVSFDEFGDTRVFPKGTIDEYLSNNMSFFKKGYFYVNAPDVVDRYGLSDLNKNMLTSSVIENIADYSENEIRTLIQSAPKEQKEVLCDIIVDKYVDGDVSDIQKIKLIDEYCDNTGENTIISRGERRLKMQKNS